MKRRGTTVLELLTVISLLAVLLGIGASLLTSLMRMHRRVSSDIDQRRTLVQLADRFRQDAHAAHVANLSPEGRLSLSLAEHRIVEYAATNSHITRQVLERGVAKHRETFTFSPACKLQFALEKLGANGRQLVRCEVIAAGGTSTPRAQFALESVLEAAVGISAESPRSPRQEETPP